MARTPRWNEITPEDCTDFVNDLRRLADGHHVTGVSTTKGGYRRVNAYWLGLVANRIERLERVVESLVKAWDSIPEDVQVPEEININELWDEAHNAVDPYQV